jgi:iron(III) transport system permease protein
VTQDPTAIAPSIDPPRSATGSSLTRSRITSYALLAVLLVITVLPIAVLVLGSFLSEPPRALHVDIAGLTLRNYIEIFRDGSSLILLRNTFFAATIGTVGAMLIGTSLAWLTARTDIPLRRLVDSITLLPMLVPPLVAAFAWDLLASPKNGIINILGRAIGAQEGLVNLYSLGGISFVFILYYAPYVFLLMSAALRNLDPSLEEAAAICGASWLRRMSVVVLPLMAPAFLSAALLVFVFLIELFAIPAVLGQPGDIAFMSVRIWELIGFAPPRINQASALGVVMLVLTMTLVLLQYAVTSRRSFVTVSGKGARREPVRLHGWRWPLAALVLMYIVLAVVLPYAALLLVAFRNNIYFFSLSGMLDPSQFSLKNMAATLSDPVVETSLKNSLLVAAATVIGGSLLYFAIAYVVHRTKLRGRQVLDVLAMLPMALPGLVIGLGYLWTWISLPVGVYGTLWIIVIAYVSQFSPQGVRSIGNSLAQIHPELEESARVCGGRFFYTLGRVVLPLTWPGIQSAMILLMIFSFREISTALFLYTANTQVFSVTMFDYWVQGTTGSVAVMTLLQTGILLVLILLGQTLRFGTRTHAPSDT